MAFINLHGLGYSLSSIRFRAKHRIVSASLNIGDQSFLRGVAKLERNFSRTLPLHLDRLANHRVTLCVVITAGREHVDVEFESSTRNTHLSNWRSERMHAKYPDFTMVYYNGLGVLPNIMLAKF